MASSRVEIVESLRVGHALVPEDVELTHLEVSRRKLL
jgi:hypothetical protein